MNGLSHISVIFAKKFWLRYIYLKQLVAVIQMKARMKQLKVVPYLLPKLAVQRVYNVTIYSQCNGVIAKCYVSKFFHKIIGSKWIARALALCPLPRQGDRRAMRRISERHLVTNTAS